MSECLVVGFTGEVTAAEVVMHELVVARPSTAAELEGFLLSDRWSALARRSLALIGWIADPRPQAFRWDLGVPSVYWGEPIYAGSGSDELLNAIDKYTDYEPNPSVGDLPSTAVHTVLRAAGSLMALEVGDPRTLTFGRGYEGLYWDQVRGTFTYVDDVLFILMGAFLSEDETEVTFVLSEWFFHYLVRGDAAVIVQIRQNPKTGGSTSEIGFQIISPVPAPGAITADLVAADIESTRRAYDLDTDYHVVAVAVYGADLNARGTSVKVFDRSDRQGLTIQANAVDVSVPAAVIRQHLTSPH